MTWIYILCSFRYQNIEDLLYFDHFPWFITHYSPNFIWQAKPILTCFYFLKPSFGVVNYFWIWWSIILDLPGQLAWIIQQCGKRVIEQRGKTLDPLEVAKRGCRRRWGIIWGVWGHR